MGGEKGPGRTQRQGKPYFTHFNDSCLNFLNTWDINCTKTPNLHKVNYLILDIWVQSVTTIPDLNLQKYTL